MKRILSSSKVLIMLSVLIFSLSVLKVCLDSAADTLEVTSMEMAAMSRKSSISQVNKKTKELESVMADVMPTYMSKEEASRFLAESAENIKQLYNGKYFGVIKEAPGRLYVELEFTIVPPNPEVVTQIADYLENSTAPIIYVNRLIFREMPKGGYAEKSVTFNITLTQPYFGGEYEY